MLTKIISFKTPMLRSDLCDYSDAYISISLSKTLMMLKKRNKKLILKINASFKSCISNINGH